MEQISMTSLIFCPVCLHVYHFLHSTKAIHIYRVINLMSAVVGISGLSMKIKTTFMLMIIFKALWILKQLNLTIIKKDLIGEPKQNSLFLLWKSSFCSS